MKYKMQISSLLAWPGRKERSLPYEDSPYDCALIVGETIKTKYVRHPTAQPLRIEKVDEQCWIVLLKTGEVCTITKRQAESMLEAIFNL